MLGKGHVRSKRLFKFMVVGEEARCIQRTCIPWYAPQRTCNRYVSVVYKRRRVKPEMHFPQHVPFSHVSLNPLLTLTNVRPLVKHETSWFCLSCPSSHSSSIGFFAPLRSYACNSPPLAYKHSRRSVTHITASQSRRPAKPLHKHRARTRLRLFRLPVPVAERRMAALGCSPSSPFYLSLLLHPPTMPPATPPYYCLLLLPPTTASLLRHSQTTATTATAATAAAAAAATHSDRQ